jgi:O-methyltransferase involved in polyketide biosynthesis
MPDKIKLTLSDVQKTLILPLWGRAVESRKAAPILIDAAASAIIDNLDVDFSALTGGLSDISQLGWAARAAVFDGIVKRFLEKHPRGSIVNLGCGLDTTFERIDNGELHWYDLDLPEVIKLRRLFLKPHARRKFIPGSFLETGWFSGIPAADGVLFMASGVFYFIDKPRLRAFITRLADAFPGGEIAFDATASAELANKMVVKKANLGQSLLVWSLKNPRDVRAWDRRIVFLAEYPLFKSFRKKAALGTRMQMALSDALRLQYVVHVRADES